MEQLEILKERINKGEVENAIAELNQLLQEHTFEQKRDVLYYLLGNAYRKTGNWKKALDNYQFAIDLNPTSPALQARKMAIDILNFYHKDMYNQ